MMNLLNLSDMVVLNAVKEKEAQFTCKAVRGEGIDDYIAVSGGLWRECQKLNIGRVKKVIMSQLRVKCK